MVTVPRPGAAQRVASLHLQQPLRSVNTVKADQRAAITIAADKLTRNLQLDRGTAPKADNPASAYYGNHPTELHRPASRAAAHSASRPASTVPPQPSAAAQPPRPVSSLGGRTTPATAPTVQFQPTPTGLVQRPYSRNGQVHTNGGHAAGGGNGHAAHGERPGTSHSQLSHHSHHSAASRGGHARPGRSRSNSALGAYLTILEER